MTQNLFSKISRENNHLKLQGKKLNHYILIVLLMLKIFSIICNMIEFDSLEAVVKCC